MSVVNAGALGRKEQQREADFGENGNKAMKYLSRRDVPTSRRPYIPTWGQQLQKSTSPNVVTSQRRDISTSRRQLENCIPSFKAAGVLKLGYWGGRRTKRGTDFQSRVTQTSRECSEFVPLFIFWIFSNIRMMFSLLNICIFSFVMF